MCGGYGLGKRWPMGVDEMESIHADQHAVYKFVRIDLF